MMDEVYIGWDMLVVGNGCKGCLMEAPRLLIMTCFCGGLEGLCSEKCERITTYFEYLVGDLESRGIAVFLWSGLLIYYVLD
jgi:hypothetical protein